MAHVGTGRQRSPLAQLSSRKNRVLGTTPAHQPSGVFDRGVTRLKQALGGLLFGA